MIQTIHLSRAKGFTLIELMVVVALMGIMAAMAAPSFNTFLVRQRIKDANSELVSHLTLARSEAIKRNSDVTIGSVSTSANWSSGWKVTAVESGVITTLAQSSNLKNLTLSSGTSGPGSIVFNRSGRTESSAATISFQISDASPGSTVTGRCVSIGLTGVSSSKDGNC